MNQAATIYKIATAADWAAAERAGSFAGSAHDKADGFLHFSTGPQLAETLRLYYAGQNDLVLVAVDAAALGDALKWEHSAARGEDFPHLFALLTMSAVKWARPIGRDGAGITILPALD
ncbi:MAG TPA: DUF952 domain-containing protein [Rhizomicrobium sp.]|nr:DUF952 domain-containing protein [Rhizomicrobium sp.]